MAKNAIEAKKRIAHNKSSYDNIFGSGDGPPGEFDYVTSMINQMEGNVPIVYPNNINLRSEPKSTKRTNAKKDTALSNRPRQSANVSKSKFGMSSKNCPLMAKSRKILKHLRHNRKIPKQRAHLATIDSPVQNKTNNSEVSLQNINKTKQGVKNLKKAPELERKSVPDKPVCNVKNKPVSRQVCPSKSKTLVDSLNNIPDDSSDGNTTDSEYERFVKINKKGLQKKGKKPNTAIKKRTSKKSRNVAQNDSYSHLDEASVSSSSYCRKNKRTMKFPEYDSDNTSTSSNSYRRKSKKVMKPLPSEQDSEQEQEASTSSSHCRKSKRIKAHHKVADNKVSISFDYNNESEPDTIKAHHKVADNKKVAISFDYNNESEPDTFDGDIYTRDSSAESDVADNEIFIDSISRSPCTESKIDGFTVNSDLCSLSNNNVSNTFSVASEPVKSDLCSLSNNVSNTISVASEPVKTDLYSLFNNNMSNTISVASEPVKSDLYSLSNKNVSNTISVASGLPTACLVNTSLNVCPVTKSDSLISVNSFKEIKQSPDDILLIDLSESEDESETVMSKEISTAVVPKKEASSVKINKNDSQLESDESDIEIVDVVIMNNSPKSEVECNVTDKGDCCLSRDEINIKIEKVGSSSFTGNENLQNGLKLKVEQETDVNEQCKAAYITNICSTRQDEIKDSKVISKYHSDKNILAVKKEINDEDDIIILDSDSTQQTETIEQFNSKQNLGEDLKSILGMYKSEFHTYQEIIQTEATIGATFKMLESRQAKRLLSLKTVLKTYLEGNDDNSISFKKEMSSLFESSKTLDNTSHKVDSGDFGNYHSQGTSGTAQDFQTSFSTASSIGEGDIKPNASQLQSAIESMQAQRKSCDINTSFGEKCNVCGKDAVAACQQCARVFFCSNECGKKYWIDGHESECCK